MGGLVEHLDLFDQTPDPPKAWLVFLGQLAAQAASGQLPEGHHFLFTLSGVARDAVGRQDRGLAVGLSCLLAASCASTGDFDQVRMLHDG